MFEIFCSVIIVAAGKGLRLGSDISKQFLCINNKPILIHTIEKFESINFINEIIVVLPKDNLEFFKNVLSGYNFEKVRLTEGGKERQDSVVNGLKNLSEESEIVLVHDGVRPFVKENLIVDIVEKTIKEGSCIPAVKVKDTIKRCDEGIVLETVDRQQLYSVQTPQGFRTNVLKKCYAEIENKKTLVTDDASLLELCGEKVFIIEGDYFNIKITTKEDLLFAKAILEQRI